MMFWVVAAYWLVGANAAARYRVGDLVGAMLGVLTLMVWTLGFASGVLVDLYWSG